jgi:hypothetical protein
VSQNNSQMNSRLVFENAKSIITAAGLNVASAKLTQSDLRLEQQLVTTKTQYQFAVLNNNNGPSGSLFNTEVRLTQQDSFVAASVGFFLAKPTSATDATFIAHTYPSPVTFSTAGTAAAAETLYNSLLAIMINNDNVLPVWHLGRHRMVPQSQAQTGAANANNIAQDQIDLSSDGFVPVEPNLLLIGSKNNVITVTLPSALAAVEANQRAILWFRGVLAQNSTIIT